MTTWSHEETFKFIKLYQNEPTLWNPDIKSHKDKTKVNDAWDRIANEMDVSVAELKKKKETLMAAFRLNHKKVIASHKCGAGEFVTYKPIWVYYDALAEFMSDIYDCKTISRIENALSVHEEHSETSNDEELFRDSKTKNTFQCKDDIHKSLELYETLTSIKNSLSNLNNILNCKQKNECEDDCDLYCRLLANKLRRYTEDDRQELMYEIDGLLLKKKRMSKS